MFRRFPRLLALLITGLPIVSAALAQQHTPSPAATIYGDLLRLRSMTSVLYVAAHPDDENTRLLSWLATGRHIRTGYLSLTRGDGGQNIIGGEQGAALGLIRTHELLAARRLDGAEQYFARAIDFGFSKNATETFRQWDSAALVQDVITVLQSFRPDVVICRFPKDSMAGHGQHAASAILAEAAVRSVLQDPSAWHPTRLLFNAFRFGDRSTIRDDMFKLEVGHYDPLLGMGYGELAGISRSLHRSQGAGTPRTPGVQPEHFQTWVGERPVSSLFNGIDTTWSRVGRADIGRAIDAIITSFDMRAPDRSLPALLDLRRQIASVADAFWRSRKLAELDAILLACIGLTADATVNVPTALPGDSLRCVLRVTTRAGRAVTLASVQWPNTTTTPMLRCAHDSLVTMEQRIVVPPSTPVTEPYWLALEPDAWLFRVARTGAVGMAVTPPQLTARVSMLLDADTITATLPISFKKLDPLDGDVIEELRITPPVSIEPVTRVVLAKQGKATISVRVRAYAPVRNATLHVLDGDRVVTSIERVSIRATTDTLINVSVALASTATVRIGMRMGEVVYDRYVSTITYDHLPTLQYTQPATVRVVTEPVAITAKRIAYIKGAGEYTPEFLQSIGCTVDEITDETILRTTDLLAYDAVLVGIRAVNTRPSMKFLMPALMQYVERGGTLVMTYMTTQDMSTKDLGPFPLPLSRARVTEEDAEVTILRPEHPLMLRPNRITKDDFAGWVQERGLYFPAGFDARYEPILAMHDTNEAMSNGPLLYARHGKGHYVYCALSLFRQIPAGVPGGMRLLANMLSVGR